LFRASDAKKLIVGHWIGHTTNPPVDGAPTVPSLDFDFEFRSDGTMRMGKGKVWVEGKYEFLDPKRFEVHMKRLGVGPYDVVEATQARFVYERTLDAGGIQRTELTRRP
jgi:hypothetical protein